MLHAMGTLTLGGSPAFNLVPIAADGPMSDALEYARNQLAACTNYQKFLNVSSSESAATKTFLAALPTPADGKEYTPEEWEMALRPFGMIYTASAAGYGLKRSAFQAYSEHGRMYIELEATIPNVYQPNPEADPIDLTADLEAADRWIINQIGKIIDEFIKLSGQPGYLNVASVMVMMGPSREQPEETLAKGFYYWTLLEVIWGVD